MAHRDTAPAAPARLGAVGIPQAGLRAASLRFDWNEIGDLMSEVVAYGTAVTVKPAIAETGTIPEAAALRDDTAALTPCGMSVRADR
jgi:hypothetical protein